MAATNWTVIRRNKKNHEIILQNLKEKCTYKTAEAVAKLITNHDEHELVCVVETNKIKIKNDKEEEKKTDI